MALWCNNIWSVLQCQPHQHAMLTVRRLIPKVTDHEALKNSNAVVGIDRGSQVACYLVDVLVFKHDNIRNFTSPEECAHALGNREIAAVFLAAPYAKLFLTKYCKRFTTSGTTFDEGGFAFVFPKGSPMVPDFTKALLNLSGSGTHRDIEKRTLGSEKCVDQEAIQDEYESLGLGSFWSLFLLTGGTSTVALAIYGAQNISRFERRRFVTIISEVRKYFVHRRKQFSRKVSDVENAEIPDAPEIS